MTRAAFKALLEEILRVPPGSLAESDTRETVENWSSLVDVEIMTIISSELGVDAELLEYETIGELLDLLQGQQVFTQ
jgi:acyl carrier protein